MANADLAIGADTGSLAALTSYADHEIDVEFLRWPVEYVGANGKRVGDGLPVAIWRFPFLSEARLNSLRALWTVAAVYVLSNEMAITTRMDDGKFDTFNCMGHWPSNVDAARIIGGFSGLEFRFTQLVLEAGS